MKKREAKLRVRVFIAMLVLPTVLWWILSLTGLSKKLDYDTGEKRNKHEFSEDTNVGNFTSELEAYYNDRVPFRSILLSINSGINFASELPYTKIIEPLALKAVNSSMKEEIDQRKNADSVLEIDEEADEAIKEHEFVEVERVDATDTEMGYVKYKCTDCGEEKKEVLPMVVDGGIFPLKYVTDEVVQGRNGWLFYAETLSDYQGYNLCDEEFFAEYLKSLTLLRDTCEANGKELYVVSVPNKCSVYPEYMPTLDAVDKRNVQYLEAYIKTNSDVNFDYVYEEMLEAKKYNKLYYKYDTHWTDYGAAVAVNALYKMMGMPLIDVNSIETMSEPRVGDLVEMAGWPLEQYVENNTTLLYKPDIKGSEIIEGDLNGITVFTSNAENKKNVVVLGDSYRIATYDLLPQDFGNITFVNFKSMDYLDPLVLKTADVIIVFSVERNTSWLQTRLDTITNLIMF